MVAWLAPLLRTVRAVFHRRLADLVVLHPIPFLILLTLRSFILLLYHLLDLYEGAVLVGVLRLLPRPHGRRV